MADASRAPLDQNRIVLPFVVVLALIAFGSAVSWSLHDSALSKPLDPPESGSIWRWLTSPLERNAMQRLQRVRGNLNAAFALRATRDIWVVGDGGLILHSPDGGNTWEVQSQITWQPPPDTRTPQAPQSPALQKGAKDFPHFGFVAIATANATERPAQSFQEVEIVQRALSSLGDYSGPVDGVAGSELQSAIRAYQHSFNLKEDGALTGELIKRVIADAATTRNRATVGPTQTPAPSVGTLPKQPDVSSAGELEKTNVPSIVAPQPNVPSGGAAQFATKLPTAPHVDGSIKSPISPRSAPNPPTSVTVPSGVATNARAPNSARPNAAASNTAVVNAPARALNQAGEKAPTSSAKPAKMPTAGTASAKQPQSSFVSSPRPPAIAGPILGPCERSTAI